MEIQQSSIYEMAYDSGRPIDRIDYPTSLRRNSRQACPTCCSVACVDPDRPNVDCNVSICCPIMPCSVGAGIATTDCSGCSNLVRGCTLFIQSRYIDTFVSMPECIYNPIMAMGFLAMFTFQLNNTTRQIFFLKL
jgi:hypothetical protein